MQLTLDIGMISEPMKNKAKSLIILTNRDFEIIKFILEMKYSSVEDIHHRFFKINYLGMESLTNRAAYRRLQLLEENGYLISARNFIVNEKIYLATPKSYYLLMNNSPSEVFISYPLKKIDHRTFDHDHMLVQIRQKLESTEKVNSWMSDRYLKFKTEFNDLSSLNIVPDAVYKTIDGQKVALELELTLKSKERYRTKIKTVVEYLRKIESKPKAFQKVRFLCKTKTIFESISNESKLYAKYFQIELLPQHLPSAFSKQDLRKLGA